MFSTDPWEDYLRTGDGVFAVDRSQRIISWNAGATAILGHTSDEVVGKYCFDVVRGMDESGRFCCVADCPVAKCALLGVLPAGQNLEVKDREGAVHWLGVTHAVCSDSQSAPAIVHVFRDLTPLMEAKRLVDSIAGQLEGYLSHTLPQAPNGNSSGPEPGLTERENQVLVLLVQGLGTNAIAKTLTISNATARNHIQNILSKLDVHTRLEAVAYALSRRLVEPG
ncbi:MAG: PAS domain S-box protein [Chloroflexi bacterium]|nr:PAS domain S-box protein [Chloroflexota bacterium]